MISTLVVDDDFRVARIHAERVSRVDGFTCIGEAHDAASARRAVEELQPDLLLLDVYLPGEDGLSFLRSLRAMERSPDCILITAARDIETVRAGIQAGAIHHMVKPFGFDQLRDELVSYRRWVEEASQHGPVDQASIDGFYGWLRPHAGEASMRKLPLTMQRVFDVVQAAGDPIGAAAVAGQLGMSRPTAQRYLTSLERQGLVSLDLAYGATGRPTNGYRVAQRRP